MALNWTGRSHGYEGGGLSGYQSLGDALDYERDAEEISIPRHNSGHSHMHGLNRNSQQSGSFMTSTSSRSNSVKSSRTGSGHHVEPGTNTNVSGGAHHGNSHSFGSPASVGITSVGGTASSTAKDDRRDKVGQNISEDEDEDTSSRDTSGQAGSENTRAGYQAF
ncbi:hypothetical protein BGZ49_001358 [Haplosporangium sp. Z 27]|nr:hypothetical protein BGZ49_001358 [Haplosporangium sp. Z 27]